MLKKCDIRVRDHIPHNKSRVYKNDESKEKLYEYNSLGFRGEELNINVKKKIFVAGCSHTFGTGLNLEETWPQKFKEMLAKKENWELAVYPMEGHGFREASSWHDEYRRIFELFETHIKSP